LQEISLDEGQGAASTVGGERTFYYQCQTDHDTISYRPNTLVFRNENWNFPTQIVYEPLSMQDQSTFTKGCHVLL